MSRVLAVPNWSFYNPESEFLVAEALAEFDLRIHYATGDIDHGRTVTAFSGDPGTVFEGMYALTDAFLPRIDLSLSSGVHPKAGALDVAPFVCLGLENQQTIELVNKWAFEFSQQFGIPGYFYERSSPENRKLPDLRGQTGCPLPPFEFGISAHPKWGYFITGVRQFLLAVNINFESKFLSQVKHLAKMIREERESGNLDFAGVRALGFDLKSANKSQLSLNLTQPDKVSFDRIYEFAIVSGLGPVETELIGVIREQDLSKSTKLSIEPRQIVG